MICPTDKKLGNRPVWAYVNEEGNQWALFVPIPDRDEVSVILSRSSRKNHAWVIRGGSPEERQRMVKRLAKRGIRATVPI